jgi:hypothetical protein
MNDKQNLGIPVNEISKQQKVREYNPSKFLDTMRDNLRLKNDAALCRELEVLPPVISKIRHGRLSVGGALLIRIHEVTGLSIADLLFLLGDRRSKFRTGSTSLLKSSHSTPHSLLRRPQPRLA